MPLTHTDFIVMLLGAVFAIATHRLLRKPPSKDDRSSI